MITSTEPEDYPERGDWWNFERLSHWDPTHPAAAWAAHLLQEAALIQLPCPRCGRVTSVRANLNHLLGDDHRAGYGEAARWLEEADPDLFSLAVHYLAAKARAGLATDRPPAVRAPQRDAAAVPFPVEQGHTPARDRLLPGWCRPPTHGAWSGRTK